MLHSPLLVLGVAATLTLTTGHARGDDRPAADGPTSARPGIEIADCLTRFPHRRRLASERPGILAQVPEEGDRFEPGEIVARLKDEVPQATLAVAVEQASSEAQIKAARKTLELAQFSVERMRAANERRPNTFDADEMQQAELEESAATLSVDAAQDQFDVAQLEVEQQRAELNTYVIRTDRGGIVTRVVKKDGEGVQLGEEVLEIIDTAVVRVEGYVPGEYAALLRTGLPVEVVVPLPLPDLTIHEERFEGTLQFVDVSLTSGGEVRVWADIKNRNHLLREGLLARLIIHP